MVRCNEAERAKGESQQQQQQQQCLQPGRGATYEERRLLLTIGSSKRNRRKCVVRVAGRRDGFEAPFFADVPGTKVGREIKVFFRVSATTPVLVILTGASPLVRTLLRSTLSTREAHYYIVGDVSLLAMFQTLQISISKSKTQTKYCIVLRCIHLVLYRVVFRNYTST